MRSRLLFINLALFSACAAAQSTSISDNTEQNDSTQSRELQEIVIEGNTRMLVKNGAIYTPTTAEKNSATDAVDLIARMQIPQINAVSGSNSITDRFGNNIDIFINYLPATEVELQGLKTTDVLKVMYLESPQDPRFKGAFKVVNIVMKVYEFGGYTKLNVTEHALVGLSSNASVFSKFAYKSMTYDLYVGAMNWDSKHSGSESKSVFRGLAAVGDPASAPERKTTVGSSGMTQGNYPVTFRAIYNSRNVTIENRLGYTHYDMKRNRMAGTLEWEPDNSRDYHYESDSPSRDNSINYFGNYTVYLPGQFTIGIMPRISHTRSHSDYLYTTDMPFSITRLAKENTLFGGGTVYVSKQAGNHYLGAQIHAYSQRNKIDYTGNTDYRDIFTWNKIYGDLFYSFTTDKIQISPRLGIDWEHSTMNGKTNVSLTPRAQLYFTYEPNNKNSVQFFGKYSRIPTGATSKSPDTLQENELLYYRGNPTLDSYDEITANLGYSFMPTDNFSLFAYGMMDRYNNKLTTLYSVYPGYDALLRDYVNDGDFTHANVGVSFNWSLLNRSLRLSASPSMDFYDMTGTYSKKLQHFQLSASATYYIKNFYFSAFYSLRSRELNRITNSTDTRNSYYYLQAGWGNGKWNLRLTASRFLKTDWIYSISEINVPEYFSKTTSFGQAGHAAIALYVGYTFGYGKQIRRGNEIGATEKAESAILK